MSWGVRTGGQLRGKGPHLSGPPLPLPGGTTRHAAAYHPCQPSPPGNVAAFSATPSGVPAAPQHTAAGGGGGSRAGAHPGAGRKLQVPRPQHPLHLRWGKGLGRGWRVLLGLGRKLRASPTAGAGAFWAVPAAPPSSSPTALLMPGARTFEGLQPPALPPHRREHRRPLLTMLPCLLPPHLPAPLPQGGLRRWVSAVASGWTPGSDPPAPHGQALWWEIKCPSAYSPLPILFRGVAAG